MINTQACIASENNDFIDLEKWQDLVNLLAELYDAATGAIVQFRRDEFNVLVSSDNEDNFLPPNSHWPWKMKSFCRHILETDDNFYNGCPIDDDVWCNVPAVSEGVVRSYCGIPIHWPNGEPFGTVCVIDTKQTAYNKPLLRLLRQLARLIESDIQSACRLQEIESLAIKDELTGLFNRRGLSLLAEQKIKDAPRYEQAIGLLYLDVDNLKLVNDTYGHQYGDRALTVLASVLKECCRDSDIIARLGGDEFVIVSLLNTKRELKLLSDRIAHSYREISQQQAELCQTDISIGSHIEDSFSNICLDDLINCCDQAMYAIKRSKK